MQYQHIAIAALVLTGTPLLTSFIALASGRYMRMHSVGAHPHTQWSYLWNPSSHCDNCKHLLAWYELVPVLSYLLLHGRCRHCGTAIGRQVLVVEVVGLLLGLFTVMVFGASWPVFCWLYFHLTLLLLVQTEASSAYLPAWPSYCAALVGVLLGSAGYMPASVWGSHASAWGPPITGVVTFAAIRFAGWIQVRRSQDAALSARGEAALLGMCGVWFNWHYIATVIVLACAAGALLAMQRRAAGRHTATARKGIAFSPAIAVAVFILEVYLYASFR